MNGLLDETKSERIELGLPYLKELRVSPTVKAILSEEKPADMGWADFATRTMLAFVFIARILRFDIIGVIRLCVRLIGPLPDETQEHPTFVGSSDESRKPLAKASR